jgi:hypothetical protein
LGQPIKFSTKRGVLRGIDDNRREGFRIRRLLNEARRPQP